MKKFILTLIICFVSLCSYSQQFDIYINKVQTLGYNNDKCYRIELNIKCLYDDYIYVLDYADLIGWYYEEKNDPFTGETSYNKKEYTIWAMKSSELYPWISKSYYGNEGYIRNNKETSMKFDLDPNQYLNRQFNIHYYILRLTLVKESNRWQKITYDFIFDQFNINEGDHLQNYNDYINAINNIKYNKKKDNKYYDLNGKLINNPIKGNIYIHNNKKIKY